MSSELRRLQRRVESLLIPALRNGMAISFEALRREYSLPPHQRDRRVTFELCARLLYFLKALPVDLRGSVTDFTDQLPEELRVKVVERLMSFYDAAAKAEEDDVDGYL